MDNFVGVPKVKVELGFSQIAGFTPNLADADYHALSLVGYLQQNDNAISNLVYDQDAECFYRKIKWVNRSNYIPDWGTTLIEQEKLYKDSNAEIEKGRRTFEPIKTFGQTDYIDDSTATSSNIDTYDYFYKPTTNSYTSSYQGPKWEYSLSPAHNSPQGNSDERVQWLWQTQAVPGIGWALRQKEKNYRNQPFFINFSLTQAQDSIPPSGVTKERPYFATPFDPYPGSYFMICLGGMFDAVIVNDNSGICKADMDETNKNSYSIVIPINDYPFILDNNKWYNRLVGQGWKANRVKTSTNDEVDKIINDIDLSTYSRNTSPDWLLSLDKIQNQFFISIMLIGNRIYIRSSYAGSPWIFPDSNVEFNPGMATDSEKAEQQKKSQEKGSDQTVADIQQKVNADMPQGKAGNLGFSFEPIPLQIRGRGFSCGINFNPMEFEQDNSESDPAKQKKSYLLLPPLNYSTHQTVSFYYEEFMKESAGASTGYIDHFKFALPSSGNNSGCTEFGFDFNPSFGVTSLGLPADCIDIRCYTEGGYPKSALGDSIGSSSDNSTIYGSSIIASYITTTRYIIEFKSKQGVASINKAWTADGTSAAYRTPFFFRVKLKSRCTFVPYDAWVDITNHVQKISYSIKQSNDWCYLEKSFQVECLIPKTTDANLLNYTIHSASARTASSGSINWSRIASNPCKIRIWLGWKGSGNIPAYMNTPGTWGDSSYVYFTGISLGGQMQFTSQKDSITLDCKDYTYILERNFLFGNLIFDGMSIPYALTTLIEKVGLPAYEEKGEEGSSYFHMTPRLINAGVYKMNLPDSGRFTAPFLKFPKGTKVSEAIKNCISRFQLIFGTDNQGRFFLDLPTGGGGGWSSAANARFMATNDLYPSTSINLINGRIMVTNLCFYSRAADAIAYGGGLHNMLLERKTLASDVKNRATVISVETMDRFTGKIQIVVDGSIDALSNPLSSEFIGFMQPAFVQKSFLGGKAQAQNLLANQKEIATKAIRRCSIRIWGRPTIIPMEIMRVDGNNYRILEISGQVNIEGTPKWTMDVVGENRGYFNNEIDTSL